ncbi:hypothetical protein HYH02_005711 [Chlamydomonas schloesseri]|uniref:proline dehydrogenase n=1 Tax=Chlamydomonas schloesseri TaxID=2026947 RepID=A0A836B6E9_9CHLO|nr:hypothetical protein HYH02_005711 [Chlamydomonas schloesseri]|eukprot:KAG2448957.1 hypothetical protein HYH02_005711 [Chlamydomonas schloesseri]
MTDLHPLFQHTPYKELLRDLTVLNICSFPSVASNADGLLQLQWVREALYRHFTAGPSSEDVWGRTLALRSQHIGVVLAYGQQQVPDSEGSQEQCEENTRKILNAIDEAASFAAQQQGFATVKLTALTSVRLLERVSEAMRAASADAAHVGGDICVQCEDRAAWEALQSRLWVLAQRAALQGVKLILDAELSSLRPAYDFLVRQLMQEFNRAGATAHGLTAGAVVYGTYQAYMRNARGCLAADLALAEQGGYTLGAKLVAGAYMYEEVRMLEEAAAASNGSAQHYGPLWPSHSQTVACFDECAQLLLGSVKRGGAEAMLGTHNCELAEHAVATMSRLGLPPADSPVHFGQLLGMADELSVALANKGYKTVKDCPYGEASKMLQYLAHRMQETKHTEQTLQLVQEELYRRTVVQPAEEAAARVSAHNEAVAAMASKAVGGNKEYCQADLLNHPAPERAEPQAGPPGDPPPNRIICSFPPVASRAEGLLQLQWVREALYRHFVAGPSSWDVWARTKELRSRGVGAVLSYGGCQPPLVSAEAAEAEQQYDEHMRVMVDAIDEAASFAAQQQGFATAKLTALTSVRLLERVSEAMLAAATAAQEDGGGGCTEPLHLDPLHCVPREDRAAWEALQSRLWVLAQRAALQGVKLILDAELSSLRPAYDYLVRQLMQEFNRAGATAHGLTAGAVVYGTYQAYMRNARDCLAADLALAEQGGYTLGAKLTVACFDECAQLLLGSVKRGCAEAMLGTHNCESAERAVATMSRLGLSPGDSPVHFGQLLGMADELSVALVSKGYKAVKDCPYGEVSKMLPYLAHRMHEAQHTARTLLQLLQEAVLHRRHKTF